MATKPAAAASASASAAPTTAAAQKAADAKTKAEQSESAAKALSAIAAAFSKDLGTKPAANAQAAAANNSAAAWAANASAQMKNMSLADQQKAVQAALDALGGSGTGGGGDDGDEDGAGGSAAANLGKVQKKEKRSSAAADPRRDPTKLVSVPCFIARPSEFKLLRDTMSDRNLYAKTYAEYLDENYDFCHSMAQKENVQVLRGTWDVRHYLQWCEEKAMKPRAQSRKAYFHELAELAVSGKIDEPRPSFEQYIDDTKDGGVLRFCCRLGGDTADTPLPAPPVPDHPSPSAPPTAAAAAAATASGDAKAAAGDSKAAGGKKKAATKGCGKLESKPREFALCTACKCACYCSVECQKKDWKNHKKWCAKVE